MNFQTNICIAERWSNLMLKKRNFIANKTVCLFVLEKRLNHLLIHHYDECKLASFVANDWLSFRLFSPSSLLRSHQNQFGESLIKRCLPLILRSIFHSFELHKQIFVDNEREISIRNLFESTNRHRPNKCTTLNRSKPRTNHSKFEHVISMRLLWINMQTK